MTFRSKLTGLREVDRTTFRIFLAGPDCFCRCFRHALAGSIVRRASFVVHRFIVHRPFIILFGQTSHLAGREA